MWWHDWGERTLQKCFQMEEIYQVFFIRNFSQAILFGIGNFFMFLSSKNGAFWGSCFSKLRDCATKFWASLYYTISANSVERCVHSEFCVRTCLHSVIGPILGLSRAYHLNAMSKSYIWFIEVGGWRIKV